MLKSSIFDLDDISDPEETYLSFENANYIHPAFDNAINLGNLSFLKRKTKRREMSLFNETNDKNLTKALEKNFPPSPINEENKEKIYSPNGNDENRNNQASTSITLEREIKDKKEEGNDSQKSFSNNIFDLNQEIDLEENNEEEIYNIVPKKIRNVENGKDKERGRYNEIIFEIRTNQIPGRKPRDKKELSDIKKRHGKKAFDNVTTKIQVNFISFLISFANDVIKEVSNNDKTLFFKNIDYKEKSNVKSSNLVNCKKLKVDDILEKSISRKFRSTNENHNKVVYEKIINLSSEVCEEYFNMRIVPIFQKYYNNCKPCNKVMIYGKSIYLSKIIKTELIECAKLVYLNEEKE